MFSRGKLMLQAALKRMHRTVEQV